MKNERDETSHLDNLIECKKCTGWFEKEDIRDFKENDVCVDCEHELIKLAEIDKITDTLFSKVKELQSSDLKAKFKLKLVELNVLFLKNTI